LSNYSSGALAWIVVRRKLTSPYRSTRNGVSVFQINVTVYGIPFGQNVLLTFRFTNKRIKRLIPFKNKMLLTKSVHIGQNTTLMHLYIISI